MSPKTRLAVLCAAMSLGVGCDPDFAGENRALKLRFGLGGCGSVPISQGGLARGGTTDLQVADAEKRTTLKATSEGAEAIRIEDKDFTLKCTDDDCRETQGSVQLEALAVGSSRIVIADDTRVIDAVRVKVAEPTSISVQDTNGKSQNLTTSLGKAIALKAVMRGPDNTELFARTPFEWEVEGTGLEATKSKDGQVAFNATQLGTSVVTVRFGSLTAQSAVTVTAGQ